MAGPDAGMGQPLLAIDARQLPWFSPISESMAAKPNTAKVMNASKLIYANNRMLMPIK